MTKLTLVLVFLVGFGFLNSVRTEEPPHEHENQPDNAEDAERRAGAYAHASISMRPNGLRPGPPAPPGPPGPPGPQPGLVQCYSCVDCKHVQPNTTSKWCARTLDPSKKNSCVSYAEQYNHLKKHWHIRGCASERGSCADIKHSHSGTQDIVKLVSCYECEGDKCNSASRSLTDLTMAIFTLLLTPLVGKITFS